MKYWRILLFICLLSLFLSLSTRSYAEDWPCSHCQWKEESVKEYQGKINEHKNKQEQLNTEIARKQTLTPQETGPSSEHLAMVAEYMNTKQSERPVFKLSAEYNHSIQNIQDTKANYDSRRKSYNFNPYYNSDGDYNTHPYAETFFEDTMVRSILMSFISKPSNYKPGKNKDSKNTKKSDCSK
jgi:hypothetical protein